MAGKLSQLVNIISNSVATLVDICAADKVPFPDLDDPFTPQSEEFRSNPLSRGSNSHFNC